MRKLRLLSFVMMCLLPACSRVTPSGAASSWQKQFDEMLPLLGHRNWIVVTDMAYPLQSGMGITTFYTGSDYADVVKYVADAIDKAPHVRANIYQDAEFAHLSEHDVSGIDTLRGKMASLLGEKAQSSPHEELIARLDSAGRMFNVLILKTKLTVPYTTVFFELDCAYWQAEQEKALRERMK